MKTKVVNEPEAIAKLYKAVLSIQSPEECDVFFRAVCTDAEICSMAQRLKLFTLLEQKKTYIEIEEQTTASTATISRARRNLKKNEALMEFLKKNEG